MTDAQQTAINNAQASVVAAFRTFVETTLATPCATLGAATAAVKTEGYSVVGQMQQEDSIFYIACANYLKARIQNGRSPGVSPLPY